MTKLLEPQFYFLSAGVFQPPCICIPAGIVLALRRRLGAQILFVDNILVCDDKGLHTRRPILRRVSDEGKICIGMLCRDTKIVTLDKQWLTASGSARRR